ncbi:MAG: cell division protein ZapA [Eubacteriales bacterium]|jgi:cell division protein ZapA|nr:cell division protein ZapA [Eubacteriales bacterium]
MKERYTVEISGIELNLLSDEQEDYVLGLAKIIDGRINAMVMSNKRCNKTEAALVCALDYLDDKLKTTLTLENVKKQRDDSIIENQRLRKELDDLRQKQSAK